MSGRRIVIDKQTGRGYIGNRLWQPWRKREHEQIERIASPGGQYWEEWRWLHYPGGILQGIFPGPGAVKGEDGGAGDAHGNGPGGESPRHPAGNGSQGWHHCHWLPFGYSHQGRTIRRDAGCGRGNRGSRAVKGGGAQAPSFPGNLGVQYGRIQCSRGDLWKPLCDRKDRSGRAGL